MPVKLKKFGPTATQTSTSVDFINSKNDIATPVDPRILEIQNLSRSSDPNVAPTLPDGKQASYKSPLTVVEQKIYNASTQANKFASTLTSPLRKFYSTVDDTAKSIDAVKGILGERGSVQRALNQVGRAFGVDVFSLKKQNNLKNKDLRSKDGSVVSPLAYPYPRVAWEITTQWRILTGKDPIRFYVNPSDISYTQNFIEASEQLQKGYLITSWKDINVSEGNRFPKLGISFNFQSSNILPESYAQEKNFSTSSGILDTIRGLAGIREQKVSPDKIDKPYNIPPGLLNFYDVLSIFNEDRTISKLKLYNIPNALNGAKKQDYTDLTQIKQKDPAIEKFSGTPNYVYLSISTRIYPKMTMKGFFDKGYSLKEDARDPLNFKTQLSFVAYETDPAWWDIDKIKSAYLDFYRNQITQVGGSVRPELRPNISEEFNKIPTVTFNRASNFEPSDFQLTPLPQNKNAQSQEDFDLAASGPVKSFPKESDNYIPADFVGETYTNTKTGEIISFEEYQQLLKDERNKMLAEYDASKKTDTTSSDTTGSYAYTPFTSEFYNDSNDL